jgi:hypothetical protein
MWDPRAHVPMYPFLLGPRYPTSPRIWGEGGRCWIEKIDDI